MNEITPEELQRMREELDSLRRELAGMRGDSSAPEVSIAGMTVMILRLGPDESIRYVNRAFCDLAGLEKSELLNHPLAALQNLLPDELFEAIKNAGDQARTVRIHPGGEAGSMGPSQTWLAPGGQTRVLEVKATRGQGIKDILIQDVSDTHRWREFVRRYVSADMEQYSDEELRTFRYPERRYMTVGFTDLRGFTAMSESMTPEDVRATMNAYLEAIIGPVDANRATVDKIVGDELMVLYGAPRYYKDHAFRAVKTACEQMAAMRALQKEFEKTGKQMPSCGTGLNTGDMVLGNIGGRSRQDYTVLGATVNLGARLCGGAGPGEILCTESTLKAVLECLPEGWESAEEGKAESRKQKAEIEKMEPDGEGEAPAEPSEAN